MVQQNENVVLLQYEIGIKSCLVSFPSVDSSTEYEPYPAKGRFHALDFDTLLKQAQQNLKR